MNVSDAPLSENVTDENKSSIINRLRRIEGQIRGLEKMVASERDCTEILTLFSGVGRALDATRDLVLETYLAKCIAKSDNQPDIEELVRVVKLARK